MSPPFDRSERRFLLAALLLGVPWMVDRATWAYIRWSHWRCRRAA